MQRLQYFCQWRTLGSAAVIPGIRLADRAYMYPSSFAVLLLYNRQTRPSDRVGQRPNKLAVPRSIPRYMTVQLLDDLAQMRRLFLREHSRLAGVVKTQKFGHCARDVVQFLHLQHGIQPLALYGRMERYEQTQRHVRP